MLIQNIHSPITVLMMYGFLHTEQLHQHRLTIVGVSLQKIAHMLNQSNTTTTAIYAHLLAN